MSETLIGVIIGGFIASVAPIINLLLEHRRWQRQAKLEYLKQRRDKLEKLYTDTYTHLVKAVNDDSYPWDEAFEMFANITVMSSEKVATEFRDFMKNKKPSEEEKGKFLLKIKVEMKKSLTETDSEIEKLIG